MVRFVSAAFAALACAAVAPAATFSTELSLRREASWPADSADNKPFRELVAKAVEAEHGQAGKPEQVAPAGALVRITLSVQRSDEGVDRRLFDGAPALGADPLGADAHDGDRLSYRLCERGSLRTWTLVHGRGGWLLDRYSAQAAKDCGG